MEVSARAKRAKEKPTERKFTIEDLWQELQEVRAKLEASEARAAKLERRVNELEEENHRLRKAHWATEDLLQKKIRKLEKDVAERDEKIEKLNKQITWLKKEKFGSKTEQGRPEASEAEPQLEQKNLGSKRKRGQQPGSKGHGRRDDRGIPIAEVVPLVIAGGCKCPACGVPYLLLPGREESRLKEMATEVYEVKYEREKYVSQCRCLGKKIMVADPPPKLYPRTTIGNSLWVHLVVRKFLHGSPMNRTLKELSLYGLTLAEGTVTGGLKVVDELLEYLQEKIIARCRAADLWNADETTWRVFDADKTKWWLWLVASDDAVAYILDPSRSKRVPTEFFAASEGTLMTDRLAAYKSLNGSIKKAWCWVHQRRDFFNVFQGMPKLRKWAQPWLEEIAKLFVLEHKRFKLWQENKTLGQAWEEAQTAVAQQVEQMKWRWQTEIKRSKLHAEQKKILRSMKKHWHGLTLFVNDPRIPLHNNRAERLLRHAVVLRKNSYGSGAEWSGRLAAKLFSLFQTWLINGLDPQAMLLDYFNECSKTPGKPPPDVGEFLPWSMSADRKQALALPRSYKRPG